LSAGNGIGGGKGVDRTVSFPLPDYPTVRRASVDVGALGLALPKTTLSSPAAAEYARFYQTSYPLASSISSSNATSNSQANSRGNSHSTSPSAHAHASSRANSNSLSHSAPAPVSASPPRHRHTHTHTRTRTRTGTVHSKTAITTPSRRGTVVPGRATADVHKAVGKGGGGVNPGGMFDVEDEEGDGLG
jgi:hypothetical protein